ncbi:host cell division inhibitor Icd-like protein [Xenorhabdus sp. XENO-10]|uniref:Host cell division inhibitor Icd-like protein n=1 Tax=Xenorhabdus yunnanensis TaxID=3025878 RepID=A0ABT5LJY4_9GAMM|nr:host cell division inhibitor Icd-like protein [Xenorhabdus yunnanensis]MDC9591422.1 host cell division inhibitor Icd-like protein [Xenorhabdus yunnanensis]
MTTFIFAAIKRSNTNQKHPVKIKCIAENYQQAKMMLSGSYITTWAGQIITINK